MTLGATTGVDWAHLAPVRPGRPFAGQDPHTFRPVLFPTVLTPDVVTIYAQTPREHGVVASADAGVTWQPVRAC